MFAHYDGTLEDCICVKDFSAYSYVMLDVSEVVFTFANVFAFFPVTVLCFGDLLETSLHNRSYFFSFFSKSEGKREERGALDTRDGEAKKREKTMPVMQASLIQAPLFDNL